MPGLSFHSFWNVWYWETWTGVISPLTFVQVCKVHLQTQVSFSHQAALLIYWEERELSSVNEVCELKNSKWEGRSPGLAPLQQVCPGGWQGWGKAVCRAVGAAGLSATRYVLPPGPHLTKHCPIQRQHPVILGSNGSSISWCCQLL